MLTRGAAAFVIASRLVMACVGDSTPPVDAGNDQTSNDASQDVTTGDASDAGVHCGATAPSLFNPVPEAGPFCNGAGTGNHCAFGDHCCTDEKTNARTCAATCDAGTIDIACFSSFECPSGLKCCGNGSVSTTTCTYEVVSSFTGTICASTCSSSEFVECAETLECSPKACTPAYALDPTNTTTTNIQVGTCQ